MSETFHLASGAGVWGKAVQAAVCHTLLMEHRMVGSRVVFILFFHFSVFLKFSTISMDFSHPQNPDIYKVKKPILTSPSLISSHRFFYCNIFLLVSTSLFQLFSALSGPPTAQTAPSPSAGAACPQRHRPLSRSPSQPPGGCRYYCA